MTEIADSLLAKIRALLAKAEGTDSPAEAEALTAKASALMAKYGVEQAMLADADPDSDPIGDHDRIHLAAPYARDKVHLLNCVAQALGCRVITTTGRGSVSVVMFGYKSDRERAELLFTSLLVQAAHALAVTPVPWGEDKAAYRRSWFAGYSSSVYARLKAAEATAHKEASGEPASTTGGRSTALVLADRGDQVERAWADRRAGLKTEWQARRVRGRAARRPWRTQGQRRGPPSSRELTREVIPRPPPTAGETRWT